MNTTKNRRIYVTPLDVMKLELICQRTAYRRIRGYKDSLKKAANQKLTFREYAELNDLDCEQITSVISDAVL